MLSVVVMALSVSAADPGPCATPRAAVATLLSSLREDRMDLRRAARCTAESPSLSRMERERAVQTLKLALDAVGARVRLEDVPDAANHIDARSFEAEYVLARELPRVRVERDASGQWVIPADVLVDAERIYDDAVAVDLHRLQQRFPAWAHAKLLGVAAWQALALLMLIGIGMLVKLAIVRVLAWKSQAFLDVLKLSTPRAELQLAMVPVGTLALCGVVVLGTPSLSLSGGAAALVFWAVRILAAFAALTFVYRVIDVIAELMARRASATPHKMDDHLVSLVRRILKVVVVCLAVVLVLQAFGVNVGSLVAGLGIGGLAVALAAKDTIGNFFGSIAIFLDRPFQLGDWVTAGPDVEGTVEHVGFRSTQLRTIRDTVLTVPNAKLADLNLDNWGARRSRLVKWTLPVELSTSPDQLEAFSDGVRAILVAYPHVKREDVDVHLQTMADGALVFLVQFYVLRPTWTAEMRARHEILLDIVRLARDLRVPFSTRTTRMVQSPPSPAPPEPDELIEVIKAYGPGGKSTRPPGPRILPAPPSEPLPAPTAAAAVPREP